MNSPVAFLPFIVIIGAMFLITRSAKNKQRQAAGMRDQMQPGSGVRTIGGMYATVKEIHDDTVLLEVAPGVHAVYAKNAIGAVLEDTEYNRIVHGIEPEQDADVPVVPDDASSLTGDGAGAEAGDEPVKADLEKKSPLGKPDPEAPAAPGAVEPADDEHHGEQDGKRDGGADAK